MVHQQEEQVEELVDHVQVQVVLKQVLQLLLLVDQVQITIPVQPLTQVVEVAQMVVQVDQE
ncbi:MAG: hypothetical protein CME98_17945 [Hyphomonas sp.]|nr:hypothetical protein [Hyphomonas sp.]